MELVLFVADVTDTVAGDVFDPRHVFVQFILIRQSDLAPDDHAVGGGKGFAGDTRFGFFSQQRIQNSVGNAVAHLIRVSLGNGFEVKM